MNLFYALSAFDVIGQAQGVLAALDRSNATIRITYLNIPINPLIRLLKSKCIDVRHNQVEEDGSTTLYVGKQNRARAIAIIKQLGGECE